MKKTLTLIIKFSLLGSLLGLLGLIFLPTREFSRNFIVICLALGQLTGIIKYLIISKIFDTNYFAFIIIGIIAFFISILFGIMHWNGYNLIILCSILIIIITYFLWFLSKKNKTLVDFTKVSWLSFALSGYYFNIRHWIPGDLLIYISSGLFWAGLIYYLYIDQKEKQNTNSNIITL